ncbi:hypothetical protein SSX86_018410 [Deinandra increscens subsp. villosa]|uniref:Rubisco LSMT substrate-binding domain-containing protein n=1 Tax=Deinandra increscens subsp. villosa TaxID=3103831 RepID=A0AAP0GWA4_9ASTR
MNSSTTIFSSPLPLSPLRPHAPPLQSLSFTTKATPEDSDEPTSEPSETGSFEDRLSQVRLRYRSGTGKKADARKSKKTGKKSGGSGGNLFLPPVPLKEPTSGGLKVDFGFSPYSERMNGRVAALGLAALVLVELATGESVIKYHTPSIIFIQVYFVAAATAIYCKVEKEKAKLLQYVDEECGDFLTWLRQKAGAEVSSELSIGKSIYGRSLFACKPIQPGDCILKVPYSVQLAPDNLQPSINSLLGEDVSNVVKLALVILVHQRLGQASEWAPYISCLPQFADMHSTIFWSDEELKMIRISSLYHETLKHKAQIEKDFSSVKHLNLELGSAQGVFQWYPNLTILYLFIIVYFFNHDAYSETDVLSDDFKQVSEVISDENYAPGDEVLIRYGKFSNARLLLDFGFIIPRNKYDQVKVVVNAPQHDPLHALKLDLLHRHITPDLKDVNDLSSQENSFSLMEVKSSSGKGRGIPQSLRALARILCCTSPKELQDLAMEAAQNDGRLARLPLKNRDREVEAHKSLHLRFSHMIENYNAALESLTHHGSEKHTRRMQLARDFLTGELRILKSASVWLQSYCETLKQPGSV